MSSNADVAEHILKKAHARCSWILGCSNYFSPGVLSSIPTMLGDIASSFGSRYSQSSLIKNLDKKFTPLGHSRQPPL